MTQLGEANSEGVEPPSLDVDLSLAPRERWQLSAQQKAQAVALLEMYNSELEGFPELISSVAVKAPDLLAPSIHMELSGLAKELGVSLEQVILGNLHYDLLKFVWGCSAFAIETENGPLLARNLDWWTFNKALGQNTLISHFRNGPQGPFQTVGWPGFVGALSGVAVGRFAVTLNAVISNDAGEVAQPVSMLIRRVLETTDSFQAAVEILSETPIASDCLLLVTGVEPGEMVVIERAPNRFALRKPENGFVVVTNNHEMLSDGSPDSGSELQRTSCARFSRVEELIEHSTNRNPEFCFDTLRDPGVQLETTVQQMVFSARDGSVQVRLPESFSPQGLLRE
ncbi:MAG: hypothetical protein K0U98_03070 [Deltaproteobacteria bacterium]|nr:hypothetical protein [Deltaproteobacteria bacterium]